MKTTALVSIATVLIPASLFAQSDPQPVCPLVCDCAGFFRPVTVIGLGLQDNFASPSEPIAFPGSLVGTSLTACGATLLNFDDVPGENGVPANAWFADELAGMDFICDARIEVHARATTGTGSDGTSNDRIYLIQTDTGCPVPFAWSALLQELPEANGEWIPGQDTTFCLDLDALPVPGGTFNVLYSIRNGRIAVAVENDSGVDSVVLSVCENAEAVSPCDWSTVKRLYR